MVAYVLGFVLRLSYWNQGESSVWLEIGEQRGTVFICMRTNTSVCACSGSIHFSILGGRILFKDFRYHSSNQTIRVVKGQISWRYWIRRPAEEEDLSHARVVGEDTNRKSHCFTHIFVLHMIYILVKERSPLSCRIHVALQGMEWFIYNRTAAYDHIVSQLDTETTYTPVPTPYRTSADGRGSVRKVSSRTSGLHESKNIY